MNKISSFGIHWFRRDLSLSNNEIFKENLRRHNGHIIGVFFLDRSFLSRRDFSYRRFHFFLYTLNNLKETVESLGGKFYIFDTDPIEGFKKIIASHKPTLISWNRDYEPFARKRDSKIIELFNSLSMPYEHGKNHLLIEPWEIKNNAGEPYKVFTAFKKKWLEIFYTTEQARLYQSQLTAIKKVDWLPPLPDVSIEEWIASNKKALDIDESFCKPQNNPLINFKKSIDKYAENRNIPSLNATSHLSKYIKNGSLTVAEIIRDYSLQDSNSNQGQTTFLSELIWREFYYHSIYHFPEIEHEPCIKKYNNLKWENNEVKFDAWKQGKTGYPIVDAGMRELALTGFMHNRVRMITASFLVKHLHIDYRWGEQYFMRMLIDGDQAPNNGGWQWCASTGFDAQPYFRIFNPYNQAKRFDPHGSYIKKFLSQEEILAAKPIVNHKEAIQHTLKMYRDTV